jgi:hypothetical protein
MTDDGNVTSIFNRFGAHPSPTAAAAPPSPGELKPYAAADVERTSKRVPRFKVYYSNGDVELKNYAYLMDVISVAPEYLALVFTTGALVLKGQNVRSLLDDLQDEQVRTLYPFDENRHLPPEENAAVIDTIEWKRTADALQR